MANPQTAAVTLCRWLTGGLLFTTTAWAQDTAASVNWLDRVHPTLNATASWVDNVSRTSYEPSRKESAVYDASVSGTLPRQLRPDLLALVRADVISSLVDKYRLANTTEAAGHLTFQKKIGLGPQAWVLQGSVGGAFKAARLGDDRGWTTDAEFQIAKRVASNVRIAAFARWTEHDARSAVFDIDQHSFGLDARWDIAERWSLSGSASRLKGDIVANAAPAIWSTALGGGFGQVVQGYYSSRPWSVTHLYGANWVSYNVEADVDLWSAALEYAWTAHTSIELRRSGVYVVNRIGVAYPGSTWSLGISHRF